MAATQGSVPGGFSYAQAAKSRPAPTRSSQPAADAPSAPEQSTSPNFADVELDSKSWAEEVDASEKSEVAGETGITRTEAQPSDAKSAVLERTKLDSKFTGASGISSPDVPASATSHEDAASSINNGSSQTSWESKSQGSETVVPSEPAWIAERKERQSNKQADAAPNATEKATEPTPKAPVLQEAPLPTINPWAKRAETTKSKPAHPNLKPSSAASGNPGKENQKPASTSREHAPTSVSQNGKPAAYNKAVDASRPDVRTERYQSRSAPQPSQPALATDNISWPTPEHSQDVERKSSTDNKAHEDNGEDGEGKPRKKQEWKPVPVVPNIIWQTPGVRDRPPRSAPNGDRPSRGTPHARGRGGLRGGANGNADRPTHSHKPEENGASYSRPARDAVAATTRSVRASSVGSRQSNGRSASHTEKQLLLDTQHAQSTDEMVPQPIPAQSSAPLPENGTLQGMQDTKTAAAKMEAKKEAMIRDGTWRGEGRGMRRGRGRGGNREVMNGHAAQHANGTSGDAMPPQYPAQLQGMHMSRGNANFGQYARGGNRGTGYRAQSLPLDGSYYAYPRMPNFVMPQSPMLGMSAYQPGMTEMYGYPLSPSAYSPQQDQSNLAAIGNQVDYYFSADNLIKDMYLRKNMDGQGFVLLDTVAAFKRIMELTQDREVLKAACKFSEIVEIRVGDDGRERLRAVQEPARWVLERSDRVDKAQNDGPASFQPLQPAPGAFTFQPSQMMMPGPRTPTFPSMFRPADRRSMDFSTFTGQAVYSPDFVPAPTNGDHAPRQPSMQQTASSTNGEIDADVFPEEQIPHLAICVKMSKGGAPPFSSSSRTFSNGSIDADMVNSANEAPSAKEIQSQSDDNTANRNAEDLSVFWIKDNDKPLSLLPTDLTTEPYLELKSKALSQRSQAPAGTCPYDLDVLYQFLSHFLIRNFNASMYADFKHYAEADIADRQSSIGQQNLAKYYDQVLNSASQIPYSVAHDYLSFIKAEAQLPQEDRPAFKTLHRSWRNGALNLRNRKRLSDIMDQDFRQLLED